MSYYGSSHDRCMTAIVSDMMMGVRFVNCLRQRRCRICGTSYVHERRHVQNEARSRPKGQLSCCEEFPKRQPTSRTGGSQEGFCREGMYHVCEATATLADVRSYRLVRIGSFYGCSSFEAPARRFRAWIQGLPVKGYVLKGEQANSCSQNAGFQLISF